MTPRRMSPTRKLGVGAALLGSAVLGGLALSSVSAGAASGIAGVVSQADDGSTDTTAPTDESTSLAPPDGDGVAPVGPRTANGITEEPLTGDTAASVEAAVTAAYPDATIDRMETDADGGTYEAHLTLADGSHLTVTLDESFAISGTDTPG